MIRKTACFTSGIAAFIIIINSAVFSGENYDLMIKGGVNREVLNYEEGRDKLAVKGGVYCSISDEFIFNLTTLRNIDDKTSSMTWNVQIRGLNGFLDFTAGNYNLHFGSGLMMGKASYSTGDPFAKKISIGKDRTLSPANGGSPQYSFFGTVFNFYKNFDDLKIYLMPFSSLQRRYIPAGSCDEGAIDSSLFTLNGKITKQGNNTEPVNIINYGGVAGLKFSEFLNMQLYYFETDLKGEGGKNILWDRNRDYQGGGIDLIRNAGFFGEYSDRYISFFVEPAASSVKNEKDITDYALSWGCGVQNSIMNFSLRGKNTGERFHSEYSAGDRNPERVWMMRFALFPSEIFRAGVVIDSEKDMVPAYNRKYIEGTVQEEIFASLYTDYGDFDINYKRREQLSCDRENPSDQINIAAGFPFTENIFVRLRSSARRNYGDASYLNGCEMKVKFCGFWSISAGYTRIIINGKSPYYAVITPASESSTVRGFRESSHGGSVYLKYLKGRDMFYLRFTALKAGTEIKGDLESALSILF